jgi:hypothetical protein
MNEGNGIENRPEKAPAAQQPITIKGVKRQPLKLNLKKIGAEARVLQRTHDREELRESTAMWWRPLLALIGAIILGVGGFWAASKERQKLQELLVQPDSFATIAATASGVLIQQAGGTVAAVENMPICDGNILWTAGSNSETTIRYTHEDTVMFLRPRTLVKLLQKDGRLIWLGRGNVIVEAAKQPDGTNMVISTPNAEAVITGARVEFRVTSESARMDVSSGDIQVRRPARKNVTVHAGEYAEVSDKGALAVKPLSGQAPQEQKPPAPRVIVIP